MAKNKKEKATKINKKDLQKKMGQSSIKSELKKVTWPTGVELSKSTGAVLFLVFVVALIIFVSDTIFLKGNQFVSNKAIEFNKQQKGETKKPEDKKVDLKVDKSKETKKPETKKTETKKDETKKDEKKKPVETKKPEQKADSKEEKAKKSE